MFILLFVPILNSIFLVLVSLFVQFSYSTFPINFYRLIKYYFTFIKFFLEYYYFIVIILFSKYLLIYGGNNNDDNQIFMFFLNSLTFFVGSEEKINYYFPKNKNWRYYYLNFLLSLFGFYYCCFIGFWFCLIYSLIEFISNLVKKVISKIMKGFVRNNNNNFCRLKKFYWNGWMIKILMKMGVGIFLWLMISYISVSGYFIFGIWNYTSIICVCPSLFLPTGALGVSPFNWLMGTIVIIISSLVLITSIDYLDILYTIYFLCLLSFFQLFMLGFIFTDSIIIMYVNWDWLGLVSYLLINLYFNSQKNGLKAIIFNKLGDIIFLIIIAYFIYHFLPLINFFPSGLSINLVFNIFILFLSSTFLAINKVNLQYTPVLYEGTVGQYRSDTAELYGMHCSVQEYTNSSSAYSVAYSHLTWNLWLISIGLLVVFFTKSAQLPFSSWLINAIAAPTPVSSLLHSSTMVIIGVFLCLLLSPTLYVSMDLFNYMNVFFMNLCSVTLLWSLLKAFSSLNIKSIIAYSTVNQLSYMFLSFKISSLIVLFHIIIHAIFKCMLFLIAGSLIHTSFNFQNIFSQQINYFSVNYKNVQKFYNFNYFKFFIGNLFSLFKKFLGLCGYYLKIIFIFYSVCRFYSAQVKQSSLSKKLISLCRSFLKIKSCSPDFSWQKNFLFEWNNSFSSDFDTQRTTEEINYWVFEDNILIELDSRDALLRVKKFLSRLVKLWLKYPPKLPIVLTSQNKLLYISFLIGSFMLIFALSKELIIIGLINIISSSFLFYVVLLGAIGTIIYSFILIYFIFFSQSFSVDVISATLFILSGITFIWRVNQNRKKVTTIVPIIGTPAPVVANEFELHIGILWPIKIKSQNDSEHAKKRHNVLQTGLFRVYFEGYIGNTYITKVCIEEVIFINGFFSLVLLDHSLCIPTPNEEVINSIFNIVNVIGVILSRCFHFGLESLLSFTQFTQLAIFKKNINLSLVSYVNLLKSNILINFFLIFSNFLIEFVLSFFFTPMPLLFLFFFKLVRIHLQLSIGCISFVFYELILFNIFLLIHLKLFLLGCDYYFRLFWLLTNSHNYHFFCPYSFFSLFNVISLLRYLYLTFYVFIQSFDFFYYVYYCFPNHWNY